MDKIDIYPCRIYDNSNYIGLLHPGEKAMAEQKKHEWFVWPKDSHTNGAFAMFIESGDYGFEADTLRDALCGDNKKRNLWRTSEQDAWFLWRSRIDLKFEIFNRLGPNGKIRNVTFLFKKDRRSPKKRRKQRIENEG